MAAQIGTLNRADREFLSRFPADEETASEIGRSLSNDLPYAGKWMAITDLHRLAVTAVVQPLSWLAETSRPAWYVASELAVYYLNDDGSSNFIVPDVFVARAPRRLRTSYHITAEGSPPSFVLEVVSTESRERDTGAEEGKVRLYGLLGVVEYAIFDPERTLDPPLQGYHRGPGGGWIPWPAGARGELRSSALGLTLVADGTLLRLEDALGRRLPTADEEHERAEQERTRADAAEAEMVRMRALLARHGLAPDP